VKVTQADVQDQDGGIALVKRLVGGLNAHENGPTFAHRK
jgi:hypothetical protein